MILTQEPQTSSSTTEQPTSPSHPEVNPQSLTWLWPNRIPSGKLTLLDGSPGCGTTLFAITLAVHVSTGQPWPDDTPCPHGKVLFIAPHDHFHDTLLPRLNAAGAREDQVLCLTHISDPTANAPQRTRPFSLAQDLSLLEQTITTQGIILLIIDPYSALPGWRRSLPALISLTQRTGCAIVLTRSLSRSPSNPLQPRCPASTALTAARSHLLLAPDPRNERHCLLLTPKHSLSAAPAILAYAIATKLNQPCLSWLPAPDPTALHRLCTGPFRSPHRRAILQFLYECPEPRSLTDILAATSYDYEAGRKMLLRMAKAGELISLDRGLYTTADHSCLANRMADSPSPSSTPVDSLQNVPAVPADASPPSQQHYPRRWVEVVPLSSIAQSAPSAQNPPTTGTASTRAQRIAPPSPPAPQPQPSGHTPDPLMQLFKQQLALEQEIFARAQAATRLAQKNKHNVPTGKNITRTF